MEPTDPTREALALRKFGTAFILAGASTQKAMLKSVDPTRDGVEGETFAQLRREAFERVQADLNRADLRLVF